MKSLPLAFATALPLLFLADPAAGELKIAEVTIAAAEIDLLIEDPEGTSNQFVLQHTADLSSIPWANVPSADFIPLGSRHSQFKVPLGNSPTGFFRVVGSYLGGAPGSMNQVRGGRLSALSSLGELDVASFFMGETEATWAEWRAVRTWAAARGYDIGSRGQGCADDHPVHSISWFDALKWCNARSEQAGLTPVYTVGGGIYRMGDLVPEQNPSANGYRLPTEEEWEFAARGGTQSQGYVYSGGDDLGAVGRSRENSSGAVCDLSSGRGTWPVGQELPNELGQHDMSGNVWEWCWDAVGDLRRIRGGSWNDDAAGAALSMRSAVPPGSRLNTVGFRAVRKVAVFPANQSPIVALRPPALEPNPAARIFVVGDSTVASYNQSAYPWRGWGQELPHFLSPDRFTVINRARGGRSSRSFIEEGLWAAVKTELRQGDYLLIQWGHNDRDWTKPERYTSPTDYKIYLGIYVNEARALGVEPILITPMVMNAWSGTTMRNVFTESGNNYAGAMKEVAASLNVPLIDLNARSHAFFRVLDYDTNGRFYFNTYVAGEYPNYPNGSNDGTHFQEMGALMMAKFVAEGFRELDDHPRVGRIANGLKPLYPISIKANIPSAGRISLSTAFPVGATFTLKALPGSGHTFVRWRTGANQAVTTSSLTMFQVAAVPYTFIAYFNNETLVSPLSPGSVISGGVPFDHTATLTAEAYDPDGSVIRVEYFAGEAGAKIAESSLPPFSVAWEIKNGSYEIWAEAVDNAGARTTSPPFQLNTAP